MSGRALTEGRLALDAAKINREWPELEGRMLRALVEFHKWRIQHRMSSSGHRYGDSGTGVCKGCGAVIHANCEYCVPCRRKVRYGVQAHR